MSRASTRSRRTWVLPLFVIDPCTRDTPDECSLGTSPTNEPMVLPVNRAGRTFEVVSEASLMVFVGWAEDGTLAA